MTADTERLAYLERVERVERAARALVAVRVAQTKEECNG